MTALDPREQFQKFHEKEREEWRNASSSRTFQMAIAYALADMSALGYTQEAMKGANLFIRHLLNLPLEIVPPASRYPSNPLQEEEPQVQTPS